MQVVIKRTKGRKPFVITRGLDKAAAPNFNFNVSHEVCEDTPALDWPQASMQAQHGRLPAWAPLHASIFRDHSTEQSDLGLLPHVQEGV